MSQAAEMYNRLAPAWDFPVAKSWKHRRGTMEYTIDGREVEIEDVEGEIGEGAYAIHAYFADDGTDLNDEQLDRLNDAYAESIYSNWYENQCDRAYDMCKGD